MPLELTKKQLFDRIQLLYPRLGPNKLAQFKDAAAEAFWIEIDVLKESVDPVSEVKVALFLDLFVKNTKHFWNQPKNKKWFKKVYEHHQGYYDKVWNFDYLVPPPPPPPPPPPVQVVPEAAAGDIG